MEVLGESERDASGGSGPNARARVGAPGSLGGLYVMLTTRLTERFSLEHPVILAPMAFAAGGALAAAVSRAGGLGLIGGGYGDAAWLEAQRARAGDARVGCGFIT